MRVSLSGEIFPKRALITDDSTLVNRPSRIKEATLSPVVIQSIMISSRAK